MICHISELSSQKYQYEEDKILNNTTFKEYAHIKLEWLQDEVIYFMKLDILEEKKLVLQHISYTAYQFYSFFLYLLIFIFYFYLKLL